MFYVGLDIHDKRIAICVLGETGQIVRRAQVRTIDEMMRILEGLPDRFEVCYEASCGYGHYHDLLSPIAARVTVAHPGRLRLIFRSKDKNDRKDAERLAKLLYLGEAPAVHVPAADVRTWREADHLPRPSDRQADAGQEFPPPRLRCAGVVPPGSARPVDEAGPGVAPSAGAADDVAAAAPGPAARGGRGALAPGGTDRDTLKSASETLAPRAPTAKHPRRGGPYRRGRRRLHRRPASLRDAKAIGRYFGLVPSQDQSGDRNRLGHITREGPAVVRQLVAEATWQAVRRSPTVRAYFERVRRDDPQRKKVALVATAHYLVRVMWALLNRGTTWEEGFARADEPKGVAPSIAVI